MVTNITIINKIMNEYLLKYLQQGYTINTQTMHGSQSDCPYKIDLSKGNEFVRIYTNRESAYGCGIEAVRELRRKLDYDGDVYTIGVARGVFDDKRYFARDDSTVWMDRLEIIESRHVYTVGWRRNLGYTEDLEDVKHACEKQNSRNYYCHSYWNEDTKDYTDIEHLRIGLRVVKKQPRTKTIHLENIDYIRKSTKHNKSFYTVFYTTNSGKSDSVRIK
jgi:hypothetical protein